MAAHRKRFLAKLFKLELLYGIGAFALIRRISGSISSDGTAGNGLRCVFSIFAFSCKAYRETLTYTHGTVHAQAGAILALGGLARRAELPFRLKSWAKPVTSRLPMWRDVSSGDGRGLQTRRIVEKRLAGSTPVSLRHEKAVGLERRASCINPDSLIFSQSEIASAFGCKPRRNAPWAPLYTGRGTLTSAPACCRRYRSALHHVWTHYS